jgi:integrase/recombinase XerD
MANKVKFDASLCNKTALLTLSMPLTTAIRSITAMRGRRKGGTPLPQAAPHQGLDAHIDAFLSTLSCRAYSAASIHSHRWALRQFSQWAKQQQLHHPSQFRRADLSNYQHYLFHYLSPRGQKPLATNTQITRLGCIRRFFAALCRQNLIPANPASDLDLPRKQSRPLPKTLSAQEIDLLLALPNIHNPFGLRDRTMLELLYATGIRRTELSQLDLGDYDPASHSLTIRKGKGGKSRLLPVGERAAQWLESYLLQSRPAFSYLPDQSALFLSGYGTRITPAYLGNWIKKLLLRCGIHKTGSCHLFRHTCATDMHRGGADIRYVQEMLGHARMETTQIYTHVHIEALREIHRRCHPHGKMSGEAQEEKATNTLDTEKTSFQEPPKVLEPKSVQGVIEKHLINEPSHQRVEPMRDQADHTFPESKEEKNQDPPEEEGGSSMIQRPPCPSSPPAGPGAKPPQETQKTKKKWDFSGVAKYYGYRYYHPQTGRWINRDPIEEKGGLNLYGFLGNDGVDKWDLLGNVTFVQIGPALLGIATLAAADQLNKCSKSYKNNKQDCISCAEFWGKVGYVAMGGGFTLALAACGTTGPAAAWCLSFTAIGAVWSSKQWTEQIEQEKEDCLKCSYE